MLHPHMSVSTWTETVALELVAVSERLRRSPVKPPRHVELRDLPGRDRADRPRPSDDLPAGSTRLDPDRVGRPRVAHLLLWTAPGAVEAMRAAATAESLNQYTPDLIEPLRDAAAAAFGRSRDEGFEVVGTEGTQAAVALALLATVDPGDEVIVSDPGYFHIPSAVLAAGGAPVAVPIRAATGFRLDPDDVARAITPRTRAICIVDPLNPYRTVQTRDELTALADLADRHGLLLIHDVTHAPLALDPDLSVCLAAGAGAHRPRGRGDVCVALLWDGGSADRVLSGPPGFVRGCLQLKAALTRLNTNLISQHGALAALTDESYLAGAARTIVSNLRHLEGTLDDVHGARLVVRPQRGLACAVDVSGTGASAQELMVALFARRVAVYPGDGLGDTGADTTIRINLSRPDAWAMEHLRSVLADAVAEAAAGRWRDAVVSLLERKGTERAARLARQIGGRA